MAGIESAEKTYSFSINPLYIYLYEPSIPVFLCLLMHKQRRILSLCELAIHYDILRRRQIPKIKLLYYIQIIVGQFWSMTEMDISTYVHYLLILAIEPLLMV